MNSHQPESRKGATPVDTEVIDFGETAFLIRVHPSRNLQEFARSAPMFLKRSGLRAAKPHPKERGQPCPRSWRILAYALDSDGVQCKGQPREAEMDFSAFLCEKLCTAIRQ